MKTYTKPGKMLWYDTHIRFWTMTEIDEQGNQIGDAAYTSSRQVAFDWYAGRNVQQTHRKRLEARSNNMGLRQLESEIRDAARVFFHNKKIRTKDLREWCTGTPMTPGEGEVMGLVKPAIWVCVLKELDKRPAAAPGEP
jgi:hypothetical protein